VILKITLVTDGMFPVPTLPDATFAFADSAIFGYFRLLEM
jgi:hypothetical protein